MAKTKKYHKSKGPKAQKVVLPEAQDVKKAKHLPMFGPGIVISVPLALWPAYADLYKLGNFKRSTRYGVDLFVERKKNQSGEV